MTLENDTSKKSFESEWLDYVLANRAATLAYRRKMARLHRAYTAQIEREVHAVLMAVVV